MVRARRGFASGRRGCAERSCRAAASGWQVVNLARTVSTRLFVQAVLLLLLSAAAVSIWAHRSFAPALLPEVEQRTIAMGRVLASQLERPISLGIPLEEDRKSTRLNSSH